MVKVSLERKEAAWKVVLGVKDKNAKEKCMEVYNEKKRKVKMCTSDQKGG